MRLKLESREMAGGTPYPPSSPGHSVDPGRDLFPDYGQKKIPANEPAAARKLYQTISEY